ncbi:MAG TPA: heme-binding protein [Candidatus Binatia bacterium]|nr:heme-binding protein [Candidatus Binatia bacterium]
MASTTTSSVTLAAVAFATAVSAQIVDKKSLTLDGADKVIAAASAAAKRLNAPGGVIAVVDDGGNLIALARLDGTFAAGATISIGKARTAVLFKTPTKVFEDIINKGRTAMTALNDFTPLQGGVPIEVDGAIVGGVGVSGAASAQQDEELAFAGAAAAKNFAANTPPPPVSFFDADAVTQAFAKGAVLFDGTGRNYMVHASRRNQAGQVEIHAKDTDIIYVLDGSATFVTGGTIVDGKSIEPDEIRGASMRDGDTRRIAKGDVIIVPNGTPHWFKEVPTALTYYVVKVR